MLGEPVQADGDVAYLTGLQTGSHEAHVQQDIAVNAACQVTDALLDAVVIVVCTDGGIVPGLRYEVHRGCKGTAFPRNFCVLQNAFTGSKPRKQGPIDHFILPNHPEIHEKLFSGVKVGLSVASLAFTISAFEGIIPLNSSPKGWLYMLIAYIKVKNNILLLITTILSQSLLCPAKDTEHYCLFQPSSSFL